MRKRLIPHIFVATCLCLLCACGGAPKKKQVRVFGKARSGKFYVVKPGDTIWKVARAWKVPVQDIAEWNNIQEPDRVIVGKKLYIPGAGGKKPSRVGRAVSGTAEDEPIRLYHGRFLWPVKGEVYSQFGIRGGRRHDGVDIGAAAGTPIHAAADGEVAYNDMLAGYGQLIIVRHPDHFYSAYAHNSRNVAKVGSRVKQGEVIAYVGATGHATGPHLHFEIRHGQNARNPLFFLPTTNSEVARLKSEGAKEAGRGGSVSVKKTGVVKKAKTGTKARRRIEPKRRSA